MGISITDHIDSLASATDVSQVVASMIGLLHVATTCRYDTLMSSVEVHKQLIIQLIASTMDKASELLAPPNDPHNMPHNRQPTTPMKIDQLLRDILGGDDGFLG